MSNTSQNTWLWHNRLGHCLVSWSSRKQNTVALSSTKVEYVVAGSCCAQILWMKYQVEDYGIIL